jgi:mono/diheme cytochrome c family protein
MRGFAFIGIIAILAAIFAAVYFFGGFYSVAATEPDPGFVKWALVKVRNASIERHATETPTVNLSDPALIKAGAIAFSERGCATCHGAPGVEWAKFSEAVRPDPPDLKEVAKEASAPQIFWVVKNGINMTAMPGFALIGADDKEIWNIAAFVKALPNVKPEDYKAWTAPPPAPASPAPATPPVTPAPAAPATPAPAAPPQ